ncbi:MAG: hypothetical protein CME71_02110 [Halobacteriovorax sp.]|nr:hypothetical protein [Halobacteriovorax sp.]|tara:strand:+ start:402 stop:743 length:342 start_codon:yes stop_codon:yes gene_type:complete
MTLINLLLLLLLSACSINRGNIPIIVKELEQDEIDYQELIKTKSSASEEVQKTSDCLHMFLFIPNKLTFSVEDVFKNSCSGSNHSFDNQFSTSLFYLGYGKECIINEHRCASN